MSFHPHRLGSMVGQEVGNPLMIVKTARRVRKQEGLGKILAWGREEHESRLVSCGRIRPCHQRLLAWRSWLVPYSQAPWPQRGSFGRTLAEPLSPKATSELKHLGHDKVAHKFECVGLLELGARASDPALSLEHIDSLVELMCLQVELCKSCDRSITFWVDRQGFLANLLSGRDIVLPLERGKAFVDDGEHVDRGFPTKKPILECDNSLAGNPYLSFSISAALSNFSIASGKRCKSSSNSPLSWRWRISTAPPDFLDHSLVIEHFATPGEELHRFPEAGLGSLCLVLLVLRNSVLNVGEHERVIKSRRFIVVLGGGVKVLHDEVDCMDVRLQ